MLSKNKVSFKVVIMVTLMSILTLVPLANQIGFSSLPPPPSTYQPQSPCVVFGDTTLPNQTVIIRSNEANEITKDGCQNLVDELVEQFGFRVINTSEVSGCECFEWILKN
ncbi:MAG: hypothetical protein P0116_06830 [Candidatus Nitrosocosmicus sp.]|nr:hypothetical protein [Candidatus Nitrosocosmicus sp.]